MHCWSNHSKFGYFSYVSFGRLCHLRMAVLEKRVYKSKLYIVTRHCAQVTYVMKTHQNSHMLVISLMKDHNIENPLHLNISEANKPGHSVLQRVDHFHLPLT